MIAKDVKAAIRGRENELVQTLLPGGIERAGEWHALNPSRADTHMGSFSVALHGERAGQWHDFADGEGGDLFSLVRLVIGCGFKEAVAWCAHGIGLETVDPGLKIRQPTPGAVAEWKRRSASGEFDHQGCTVDQLAQAKRLPAEALRSFGIEDDAAAFPARVLIPYHRAGKVVAKRYRADARPGQGFMWERGSALALYGLDRLNGDEAYVVLVEGESDCWCLWHAVIPAVGIPGAGCWRDEWAADLPPNARIVAVQEPDAAGSKLVERLQRSPLRQRLQVVTLPAKDSADLWVLDPDVERFRDAMKRAMGAKVEQAPRVRSHADRLRDRLTPGPMIIADLLPEGGIGALIALPGVGKTLEALAIGSSVASGKPFAGHAVTQGAVLYVCNDAPASTERRMLGMDDGTAAHVFSLTDLAPLPDGMDELREAAEAVAAMGTPLRLIVLDTWDSCRKHSGGGYADQDGGAEDIMRGLRLMASSLHCAVLVIHHATRADNGRARGTVVFDARCDWIALVEKGGDGLNLRSTKSRDGECGHVGTWSIDTVDVGERKVPILVETGPGRTKLAAATAEALGSQRCFLEASMRLTEKGVKPTARAMQQELGWGSGKVQAVVDELRAQALICEGGFSLTDSGAASLEDAP